MNRIINVGRGTQNECIIDYSLISLQHAQLLINGTNIYLNDLKSKNGSFVNGRKIVELTELKEGDIVKLGETIFGWEQFVTPPIKTNYSVGVGSQNKNKSVTMGIKFAIMLLFIFYFLNETIGAEKIKSNANAIEQKNVSFDHQEQDVNEVPSKLNDITYDFSCVTSEENNDAVIIADIFNGIRTGIINASDVTISVFEEIEFGKENHDKLLNGHVIVIDERSQTLELILNRLLQKLKNAKGFKYKIFLIDSKEVNAWTCGGLIYLTTGMYNFAQSNDELAGIIGHEVYHNELGHINDMLKARKISQQKIGNDLGSMAASVDAVLHAPFGKKDEAHCDFKGSDLCILANFNSCEIVKLWSRMSVTEGESTQLTEFLGSHPISKQRRDCLKNHLFKNYNMKCNN